MAWMEHGLQISHERYALSMKDKMAAGGLGALRIMGETTPNYIIPYKPAPKK